MQELDPIFGADMGLEDFRQAFPDLLASFGNDLWTMVAPTPSRDDPIPVGLAITFKKGRTIHDLHFVWFPWATARGKFEVAKAFIEQMRADFFVMMFTTEQFEKFFDALVDTGCCKRSSRFHGMYPGKATIFYYAKI